MATTISFAPLAGRLAAKAAEIRPADGADVSWANFAALFWCAIFEMLIALCEALDARAAAEAAGLVMAPASRDVAAGSIPARRSARQTLSGERRARRLALAPEAQGTTPKLDGAPSRSTERPTPSGNRLVWSRDPGPIRAVHAPPWRLRLKMRAFALGTKDVHIVTM